MQSTTSPIWQPRVLHIFVMMERLTGSPRDIFANVAVDMPALRRNCVLFMPLSINIFQRLLYVTLMCHYPIVMTYIISFRVSRSKHHVHFLIQWLVLYNRLKPISLSIQNLRKSTIPCCRSAGMATPRGTFHHFARQSRQQQAQACCALKTG